MHPTRILGLFLATSSVARATLLAGDRSPQNLAKAVEARADDDAKASSTDDNILSDIINTSKVTTDEPAATPTSKKTSDKVETTEEHTTEKPTSTEKQTSEPTQTKDEPTTEDNKSTPTSNSTPTPTDSNNNDNDNDNDNDNGNGNGNNDDNNTEPSDAQTTPAPAPSGGSSGDSGDNNNNDDEDSSSTPSVVIETQTTVITTTNAAGEKVAITSTSTTTTTPGLSNEDTGDAQKGMPDSTRNTVIGVVVGVGGAIILGALGFVFWRIRARKKHAEESDGLMSYDPAMHNMEKGDAGSGSISTAGRNPFQSTLENYHRPTQVNPSANF